MASSGPDTPEESFVMRDRNDATLVGKHCQYEYCNQLDFLPFYCQSCYKTYCLDHRTETAHKCANEGAWAERRRRAQLDRSSMGGGGTGGQKLRDKSQGKPCASPECKTTVGTSLAPGVHCQTCRRDYCLRHRLGEDHDCKNLTPLGGVGPARRLALSTMSMPAGDEVAQRARSALDRLRAWGSAKREQAERALPTTKTSSSSSSKSGSTAARLAAVGRLKKSARGDDRIPVEKRVYLFVEAEAATTEAKFPTGELFFSREWAVGRALDEAARLLQVLNVNNQSADERDRLRVFHVEGGRLLEFGEKVGAALQSGNTVVLLRGVGPPPDLIDV